MLEREVSRASRYESIFTLILFDIDHFKKINDTYGHLAGDAVLRQLGSIIRHRLRRDDVVARVGGEEFAILLPEVCCEGGVEVAKKLRELVQKTHFIFEGIRIEVTISLGVAEWAEHLARAEDVVRAADEKLYEAKRTGRNKVCW